MLGGSRTWDAGLMRLIGIDGNSVELGVVGYQFPHAVEPQQRQSWLIVEGSATCPQGTWSFRWPALTADDAVELARWLVRAGTEPCGARGDGGSHLSFTEPNLAFTSALVDADLVELHVSFDLEFSPPWRPRSRTGEPFVVTCRLAAGSVLSAARAWAVAIEPYPPVGGDGVH